MHRTFHRWFLAGLLTLTVAGCARQPDHIAANAIESLLDNDRLPAAAEQLDTALRQHPSSVELLRLRVILLLRLDRGELALAARQQLPADDPVLTQALRHHHPLVRAAAAQLIAAHSLPISCRDLARVLDDPQPAVRRFGAEIAGQRRDCDPNRALFRLLHDDDVTVRIAAANAFGQLREPRAAGWLIPQLNHPNPDLHRAVESALSQVAAPGNHEMLCRVYHAAPPPRQFGLALALATLQDPVALPFLVQMAERGDLEQRLRAIRALSGYSSPVVTNALSRLQADDDPAVRTEADLALLKVQSRLVGE